MVMSMCVYSGLAGRGVRRGVKHYFTRANYVFVYVTWVLREFSTVMFLLVFAVLAGQETEYELDE